MNLPIKPHCENEKNLIKIFLDGLEIFVELNGDQMACPIFIDVLVKSCKNTFQTLQLINDHVLSKIKHLCNSLQGNQGVSLVRVVLRPKVVENLLLRKHRKDQALLLEDLKQELWQANFDPNYEHVWPQVQVLEWYDDYLGESKEGSAMSLLGEKDTQEAFERRKNEFMELEVHFNASLTTKDEDYENPQAFQSGVKMGHKNSIHKNVHL
jgi:hypothetical protein